nr:putative reverse transcriptase domain-containing protein [Tanacetum cinerariifolium]
IYIYTFLSCNVMDAPPSPNHVFNFPEAEFEEDPQEEPEEEVKEDPEEDPKEDPEEGPEEDPEAEAEDDVPPPATPPVGSPITPPTYEVGGPSSVTSFPPFHLHGSEIARVEHRVTDLENREQENDEEMDKRRAFLNLQALVFERLGRDAWDARPDVGDNEPVSFGESKPPKPPGSPSNGKIVSTNTVLRGCALALFSHMFKIDLLPTRLGSFDVILRIDWLSYHRAVIVCYEKIVRIPLPNGEIHEIHGERPEKDPKSLSCIKADEVRLDDTRTVCEFPKVFSDDLT